MLDFLAFCCSGCSWFRPLRTVTSKRGRNFNVALSPRAWSDPSLRDLSSLWFTVTEEGSPPPWINSPGRGRKSFRYSFVRGILCRILYLGGGRWYKLAERLARIVLWRLPSCLCSAVHNKMESKTSPGHSLSGALSIGNPCAVSLLAWCYMLRKNCRTESTHRTNGVSRSNL